MLLLVVDKKIFFPCMFIPVMTDSFTEEISPFMTQNFSRQELFAILISTRSTSEAFTAESAAIKFDGDVSVSITPIAY